MLSFFIKSLIVFTTVLLVGCSSNNNNVDDNISGDAPLTFSVGSTFESLEKYSPYLKTVGGLAYAVHQNDGKITTGVAMTVLNPEGTILENQEYEISLLEGITDTLNDIKNKLNNIIESLEEVMNQINLVRSEVLTNVNYPKDAIDQIQLFEDTFVNLIKNNEPHLADKSELEQFASDILSLTSGVESELYHVHGSITNGGTSAIMTSFTEQLQSGVNASTDTNKVVNAYKSLEYFAMRLVAYEIKAANLLIEANLYKDKNETASEKYQLLKKNLKEVFDINNNYSFSHNTVRLILNNVDPYYDRPGNSGSFLPNKSLEILERMEFLRNIGVENNRSIGAIIYRISEIGSEVPKYYSVKSMESTAHACETVGTYEISGAPYDNWSVSEHDENLLSIEEQYQVSLYRCSDLNDSVNSYTIYDQEDLSKNELITSVQTFKYDANMTKKDDGNIVYGFDVIYDRDSAGFENLSWGQCNDSYKGVADGYSSHRFTNSYTHDDYYKSTIVDPLNYAFMKTVCDEGLKLPNDSGELEEVSKSELYDRIEDINTISEVNDCKVLSSSAYDSMSLCSEPFYYDSTDERTITIDTRLYRKYLIDAEHSQFVTDGTIDFEVKVFLKNIDDDEEFIVYKSRPHNKDTTEIQGEEYSYEGTNTYSIDVEIGDQDVSTDKKQYRMVFQMSTNIDQGITNTRGFSGLELEKKRKIRFIYPSLGS